MFGKGHFKQKNTRLYKSQYTHVAPIGDVPDKIQTKSTTNRY